MELFSLGIVPADGILVFEARIPATIPPGAEFPLQAVVTEPSSSPKLRLTNLLILRIE
jgi:hypothetical protein